MEFHCRYSKPNGEIVDAVQTGHDEPDVRRRLEEQGFLPLAIRQRRSLSLPRRRRLGFRHDDFLLFNQQFMALIRAGLPIIRSLEILESRIANPALRGHLAAVRERIVSGTSLSDAMEQEGVFPTVYTASIFAGERSGNLVEVITRYVGYQKTMLMATKKFRNALIYPAFLVVLSIVMVSVILTYVIPQFAQLYAGLGTDLPYPTQVLIAVSDSVQSGAVVFVPLVIGGLVVFRLWARSSGGRTWLDDLKLRIPVLGTVWTMFAMAQLSRTLATLLQGGIPLVSSLEVAHESSGNRVIGAAIQHGVGRVREGSSLADALEETGRFPELAIEMIGVGEQTGALPDMLNHVADFYDEDLDLRLTALLGWVEPAILVFVAGFVAAILVSLYLPIFSIGAAGV